MGIRKKGTHTAKFLCWSRIIFAIIILQSFGACNTGKPCGAYALQQCDELYPDFNCITTTNSFNFANFSPSPTIHYYPPHHHHCDESTPPPTNNRVSTRVPSTPGGTRPLPPTTAVETQIKRQ